MPGVGGVVTRAGFRPCAIPQPRRPAPPDRVERTGLPGVRFRSPDLGAIEAPGSGHTLQRHVGIHDAELRERSARTRNDASSFYDRTLAQRTVDRAFAQNQPRIGAWLTRGTKGNLRLEVHSERYVGRVFRYDQQVFQESSDAYVILKRTPALPQGFSVITAYPIGRS